MAQQTKNLTKKLALEPSDTLSNGSINKKVRLQAYRLLRDDKASHSYVCYVKRIRAKKVNVVMHPESGQSSL
jgi:hypothetical protein